MTAGRVVRRQENKVIRTDDRGPHNRQLPFLLLDLIKSDLGSNCLLVCQLDDHYGLLIHSDTSVNSHLSGSYNVIQQFMEEETPAPLIA